MSAVLLAATGWAATSAAGDLSGDLETACHADHVAHCGGVKAGTSEALTCLQANSAAVSPACRTQLARLPTDAEKATLRASCRNDYIAHCLTVPAGTLRSLQCLQAAAPSLAPVCKAAVAAATH
jgi:hypothetical protein